MTEVSWYEATAFCRWLSEQRGKPVRLPSQAEWETAATPVQGEYPWGPEEPDGSGPISMSRGYLDAVGIYPAGDGPFGHSDLAGNVWEWCEDEVKVEDATETWRALRGGGWIDPAELPAGCVPQQGPGPPSPARRRWLSRCRRTREPLIS